ncbi:FkbM family methyltransferase [Streptomyces bobili]|uniref:FkbM family methyltransferase n=1 Tax=Streptomyces bobili TaxID=67280 RepID=UPI003722D7E4
MTSQYGQDHLVLSLLNGKRQGFFLDSGASNGVRASNTQLLETQYGWSGVCVEPNSGFFAELIRNRNCLCLNCCLYDRDGDVEFVEAHTIGGILDEYHPTFLKLARDFTETPAGMPLPTVFKPARTVKSVLKESRAPRVIDYWSLDTEGSELAILQSFPFDEYSFRVLTVEHNWLPERELIRNLLENRGFNWVREIGCDDCYVDAETRPSSSWRSRVWSGARGTR